MVTIQSIMNADLDSSTTEWIEAQLSAGALGVKTPTGEMKWNRLREGLQGVVHRLASEVRWDQGRREGVGGRGLTSGFMAVFRGAWRCGEISPILREHRRTRRHLLRISLTLTG